MKLYLTIIAAFLFFMPLNSNAVSSQLMVYQEQEDVTPTHFILYLNSGEKVGFLLDEHPKVVNNDGFITVINDNTTIEYPWEKVHKYTMDIDETHTDIVNANNTDIIPGCFKNEIGLISLSGFKASEHVIISDINGAIIYNNHTDATGALNISTYNYPSGIYIVKINNQTFKFIKR